MTMPAGNGAGSPAFHKLMMDLLQFMQIPREQQILGEVYCFKVDGKMDLCFFEEQAGWVDMVAHAATLPNLKADDVLRQLLALNRVTHEGRNVSVGMDPETGAISLWAREAAAGLDVTGLHRLIETALARADAIQECLQERAVPNPHAGRNARWIMPVRQGLSG